MFRKFIYTVFLFISPLFIMACMSVSKGDAKPDNTTVVDKGTTDKSQNDILIPYGADNEVELYITSGVKFYILGGGRDVYKMNSKELRYNAIDTSIIKISHTNFMDRNGITMTYYDIRIFLSEKGKDGSAIVGIFEPAKQTWIFGEDINRANHSIEIKSGKSVYGPVRIELRSMSRLYR